jgi:hypothetical protein
MPAAQLATRRVAVIGAGPAGLMAAETLATAGVPVTIYDAMPSVGRKFLMAGRGGLNLTHSESLVAFVDRYGAARDHLAPHIQAFPPSALIGWAHGLGQETFTGSSGRVFPTAMKASPLLRAWLARLDNLGVRFEMRQHWRGWDAAGALAFDHAPPSTPDAAILALGGGSWGKLGSNGAWTEILAARGVAIAPLKPANCGFIVRWSDVFRDRFAGAPLKSVRVSHAGAVVHGEAMITRDGIEGGAVYAMSASLRDAIHRDGATVLQLDLRPDVCLADLTARLSKVKSGETLSNRLRRVAGLSPVAIGLLRESHGLALPTDAEALAHAIKRASLTLHAMAAMDRAISTAGGVTFDAVDDDLQLRALPGVYVAGEMLDWEAPTGGYLLQACFATGVAAARGVLANFAAD